MLPWRNCASLPWVLSHFSTGGPRVGQKVRNTHPHSVPVTCPPHFESCDVRDAVLEAFEGLAEDLLDKRRPAAPRYVLELVLGAANYLGDVPIAYLATNRLEEAAGFTWTLG